MNEHLIPEIIINLTNKLSTKMSENERGITTLRLETIVAYITKELDKNNIATKNNKHLK